MLPVKSRFLYNAAIVPIASRDDGCMQVRRAAICSSIIFHRSLVTWSWRRCSCHSALLSVLRSTSIERPTRASASVSYSASVLNRTSEEVAIVLPPANIWYWELISELR